MPEHCGHEGCTVTATYGCGNDDCPVALRCDTHKDDAFECEYLLKSLEALGA